MSVVTMSKVHTLVLLTERELYQQCCIRNINKGSYLSRINYKIRQNPMAFGAGIALFKSVFADYLTQTIIENKRFDEINWKRNLCFGAFGLCYTGFAHYGIYCKLYPYLFENVFKNICKTKMRMVLCQTSVDQLIHSPLIYFPVFYCVKGIIYNGSMSKQVVSQSLNEYFTINICEDVFALWKLWLPANLLTFTVIPLHLRVPWIAGVSFVWTAYLSWSRGKKI